MIALPKAYTTDPILIDLPMPIVTPRLILRPVQPGDGLEMAECIKETWGMLNTWFPWARDREKICSHHQAELFIRQSYARFHTREDMMLCGIERASGRMALFTGLHMPNWRIRRFMIGYPQVGSRQWLCGRRNKCLAPLCFWRFIGPDH